MGFAYEALARAESIAGNSEKCKEYLAIAYQYVNDVDDKADKEMLCDDLKTLGSC